MKHDLYPHLAVVLEMADRLKEKIPDVTIETIKLGYSKPKELYKLPTIQINEAPLEQILGELGDPLIKDYSLSSYSDAGYVTSYWIVDGVGITHCEHVARTVVLRHMLETEAKAA